MTARPDPPFIGHPQAHWLETKLAPTMFQSGLHAGAQAREPNRGSGPLGNNGQSGQPSSLEYDDSPHAYLALGEIQSRVRRRTSVGAINAADEAATFRSLKVLSETVMDGVIKQEIQIETSDGILLGGVLHRPSAPGRVPTLISRTPYGMGIMSMLLPGLGLEAAQQGYAVLAQDVRGRYTSTGDYALWTNDREDTIATIDCLISQDWSDGQVGIFGPSAMGATTYLAASTGHPAIKAVAPMISADQFDGYGYYGPGLPQPGVIAHWPITALLPEEVARKSIVITDPDLDAMLSSGSMEVQVEMMFDPNPAPEVAEERMGRLHTAMQAEVSAWQRLLARPQHELIDVIAQYQPWVREWAEHPSPNDEFWLARSYTSQLASLQLPVFHFAGWNDLFIRGSLRNYERIAAGGAEQTIYISPYTHVVYANPDPQPDPVMAGIAAPIPQPVKTWFDKHLRGIEPEATAAPVNYWVQGKSEWRRADRWPIPGTRWDALFLSSGGLANTSSGDGVLVSEESGVNSDAGPDHYSYDPAAPVPSSGGTFLSDGPAGSQPQALIEKRTDVLVYTGQELRVGYEITGQPRATLFIATSAVDTDFFVRLCDVDGEGVSMGITDAAVRLQYRAPGAGLVKPGEVIELDLEFSPTSYYVPPGHKLRLQVTSSSFPLIFPNLNTGENSLIQPVTPVVAEQTVFHDAGRPSRILLPVVPEAQQ